MILEQILTFCTVTWTLTCTTDWLLIKILFFLQKQTTEAWRQLLKYLWIDKLEKRYIWSQTKMNDYCTQETIRAEAERNGRTVTTGLDVRVRPVSESTTEQQSGVLFFGSRTGWLVLQSRIKLHKHKHLRHKTSVLLPESCTGCLMRGPRMALLALDLVTRMIWGAFM